MRTLKIAAYAEPVLRENFEMYHQESGYSISEYAKLEAESDPNFYRWIFNESDISDFGSDLSDEEKEIATNFIEQL